MAANFRRGWRVIRHPVFILICISLVGWFLVLTRPGVLVTIVYGLVGNAIDCESSGFPYPNQVGREFYSAQVVSIDCGATSDFDARVILSTPKNDGKGDDRETVFMSGLNPRTVALKWESTDHLVVEYEQSDYARITKSLTKWRNVTITYRVKE